MKNEREGVQTENAKYNELCREIYETLHQKTYRGNHLFVRMPAEFLRINGWYDPQKDNHGYVHVAYGFTVDVINLGGEGGQEPQEIIKSVRIELVHDRYLFKDDGNWHWVARELRQKRSGFGRGTYEWKEMLVNEVGNPNNILIELKQKKIEEFKPFKLRLSTHLVID